MSPGKPIRPKLILNFGDAFLVDEFIKQSGLDKVLATLEVNTDTLRSMILYYLTRALPNSHAQDWWEGSCARILYPNAKLDGQGISEFLRDLGDEYTQRTFFKAYFPYCISLHKGKSNVAIDSTGLPNSIHFPLTAISNHNGEVTGEVRLIYVVHAFTGLPIYFRYIAGNMVDVTTLVRTLRELKACGIDTDWALLDAGCYSEENVK